MLGSKTKKEYKTIGSRSYFTNFLMKISYELYKTLQFNTIMNQHLWK